MGSPRKQTKLIRARKAKPNKTNLKKNQKRLEKNLELIKAYASQE